MMHLKREFICQKSGGDPGLLKSIIVFDLKGMSLSPNIFGITYAQRMFQMDEKYYPERLAHMYLINAPWFFSAIYALISPFIDPVTSQKIRILGANYMEELSACIDVDVIPVEMGGNCQVKMSIIAQLFNQYASDVII